MVRFAKLFLFFAISMLFTSLGEQTERSADHNIVALQWPHSINPSSTQAYFTLHGVWPGDSKDLKHGLQFCDPNNTTLPKSRLKPLLSDLRTYWPNLEPPTTPDRDYLFWQREWVKHGTCSGLQAEAYFKNAIVLAKKFYKIVSVLKKEEKIIPGTSKKYPIDDFLAAFKSGFGAKAVIVCDGLKLKEVRFNVTNDPTPKIRDMTTSETVGCDTNLIEFP